MTEYDLSRFTAAQESGGTYRRALTELHQGRKVSHWMWFVFPQLAGLGHSWMAQHYAIASLDEARDYMADALLGPRLLECSAAVAAVRAISAADVFGAVDALKFRSCMTLFQVAAPDEALFGRLLDHYFSGEPDPVTLELIATAEQRH